MKKILVLLLACALIASGGYGCSTVEEDDAEFRIVASFYPVYITVLNLIDGVDGVKADNMAGQQTGCLHDYQLQSKDMKNIERADVFVINGAGMESFLDKVTDQLPELTVINASEGIPLLEEDESQNPHVWVSISGCMQQVSNIAEGLAQADPERGEQYRENAREYMEKLTALQEKMHAELDDLPNRDIITFHEAFPYFAEEFGLNIVRVINREPDSQPSAKELAETIRLIEETDVKAVFVEPQYPDSAADIVAAETGATVYTLDPVVTGEDDPDAYLDAMEKNMEVLKTALAG